MRRTTVETDGMGRVLDPCPNCGHMVPAPRVRIAVRPELLLPVIEAGQLRCQGCAQGIDGDVRFCTRCAAAAAARAAAPAAAAPSPAAVVPEAAPVVATPREPTPPHERRYRDKQCANCPRKFTPSGGRSKYCPSCLAPRSTTATEDR